MQHEQALSIALATDNKPASTDTDWSGVWKNQIGSVMKLVVAGAEVTGQYESATSGGGGGPIKGQLKGFVKGDLISFLVLWPGGSMTAWTGQMLDDPMPLIKTLWHLVTDIPDNDEPKRLWTSTFTGADEFTR